MLKFTLIIEWNMENLIIKSILGPIMRKSE